jgi:amino acid adenylation domain-containing protein
MEENGGLFLNWDAVEELFCEGVLDAMFDSYLRLLDWLCCTDWLEPVGDLLPPSQRQVREQVNATAGRESGYLLHEAFFVRASESPEQVALCWGEGEQITYGELAIWARRVAALLVSRGLVAGDTVAVTLPKGPEQVAAVLGILYAGGTYVPVGLDHPVYRRTLIYGKAGVKLVLSSDVDCSTVEWPLGVEMVEVANAVAMTPLADEAVVSVDALAYIIFTSGSTGMPKGVEISHRAAVNTLEHINERFGVGKLDRVLALSALDFDLSVYDLFGLLSVGGGVVLVEEESRREARRWLELVTRHGVTVWNSVPALLDMFLVIAAEDSSVSSLRLALVSGDWVGLDLPGRLASRCPSCRFVALGGATEAAIWSNAFEVNEVDARWRSIPYGFPLRNHCYRVVDGRGRDCPDWVVGELWIGGLGLAQGYRGEPELSARQFVEVSGQCWYRTGDLGRYWPDGTLEFLGRADYQVKIRGHRIELGEIETTLESHPWITRAVAVAIGEREQPQLFAAVVCNRGRGTPTAEDILLARGIDKLPELNMVPVNDSLNGKPLIEAEAILVERLLIQLLRAEFGWDGSQRSTIDLLLELGISDDQHPLLQLWLDWLISRDVFVTEGDKIAAGPRWINILEPAQWKSLEGAPSGNHFERLAVGLTQQLPALTAILRGKREPITLLDNDILAPEALLNNDPQTVANLVEIANQLRQLSCQLNRSLRVAELNARSGLTAERLLSLLTPEQVAYTLLESSTALVTKAQERLSSQPHQIKFSRFNEHWVPKELCHHFDVVIANNGLHQFRNVTTGLDLTQLLLRPGGLMLAVESAELSPLGLVSSAVLERGFAELSSEHHSNRHPLLKGSQWFELLTNMGWHQPSVFQAGDATSLILQAKLRIDIPVVLIERVRDWLVEMMPVHMVPQHLVELAQLPLSANGKIDRKAVAALLEHHGEITPEDLQSPENELEEELAEIWAELLELEQISRQHNFFALGGDSLLATRLVEVIRQRWSVDLPLRKFFVAPTIAGIASLITEQTSAMKAGSVEEGVI